MPIKHTPAPREAVLDNDPRGQPVAYYRGLIALVERGERTLAVVLGPGHAYDTVPQEQWEANAELIAAAPQLADALEAFVGQAHIYDGCFIDQIDAARAALRAAGRIPEAKPPRDTEEGK